MFTLTPVSGRQRSRLAATCRLATTTLLLVILALGLAACSEETNNNKAASTEIANLPRLSLQNCTPPPQGGVATATAASGKNVPVPAGFRIFVSSVYPYALSYPDSWNVRDNQTAGNLKSDLLVAEKTDKTSAFVYILSEKLENASQDSKGYFDNKLKEFTATQKGLAYDLLAERQIAGNPAYSIAFNASQPYQVQQVQVTFAAQGRGWVISYSATPDVAQKYCGQFVQILDTFTLTSLAN